jgi:hypothetical protein
VKHGFSFLLACRRWLIFWRSSSVQQAQRVIIGWGGAGSVCSSLINSAPYLELRDKFNVVVACCITDPTTDKFEDHRITLSAPFTIRPDPIEITVPWTKEMNDTITAMKKEAISQMPKAQRNQTNANAIAVPVWYQVFLLPKGTPISDIHRLSDIARFGGVIPN